MNEELLNILNEAEEPDQRKLLDYLEGNLDEASKAELEAQLQADPLLKDALEGLAQVRNKSAITGITAQLDRQLLQQLKAKNRGRKKWAKPDQLIIFIATGLILALVAIAWFVIYRMQSS